MAPHKFAVGQDVEFNPGPWDANVPRGLYTITRALPGDDLDRTYRARGTKDGIERVFREQQLKAGGIAAREGTLA
ncbi:hypothetical protein [Falsiroseomonas sp. HW251]|uniref:hypothetical protein n=1 Tax=Falsiroseomonas sp. HW251 TaxID=3390998 RepID=UPI003D30FD7E